jgi:hypothetical protein
MLLSAGSASERESRPRTRVAECQLSRCVEEQCAGAAALVDKAWVQRLKSAGRVESVGKHESALWPLSLLCHAAKVYCAQFIVAYGCPVFRLARIKRWHAGDGL